MSTEKPRNLQTRPVKFSKTRYVTHLDAVDPKRRITPNPAYEFSNGRKFTKRVG